MRTKPLGNSGQEISVIGLGTWAIGGSGWDYGWGAQDEKESIETILEALETGINWIDTAAVYGVGISEERVGKALKIWKKPVLVATKCGLLGDKNGHISSCIKRKSILNEVEASLKRLQLEVIDLYQIHWPSPAEDIEEAFETLLSLKKQGKIRFAGVSNFSVKQLSKISSVENPTSLQPPYSLLNTRIEDDVLPWCRKNQVGVIAYSPMQSGILTDKFSNEWVEKLAPDDWRKNKSDYLREPFLTANLELTAKLKTFAKARGKTLSQLAIAWVLRREEVTSAIVGARKKGQISETVKAADWILTGDELDEIEKWMKIYRDQLKETKHT
jgi:aryl-alcohol dehydrogenase-like predicted oxidoreductase